MKTCWLVVATSFPLKRCLAVLLGVNQGVCAQTYQRLPRTWVNHGFFCFHFCLSFAAPWTTRLLCLPYLCLHWQYKLIFFATFPNPRTRMFLPDGTAGFLPPYAAAGIRTHVSWVARDIFKGRSTDWATTASNEILMLIECNSEVSQKLKYLKNTCD